MTLFSLANQRFNDIRALAPPIRFSTLAKHVGYSELLISNALQSTLSSIFINLAPTRGTWA